MKFRTDPGLAWSSSKQRGHVYLCFLVKWRIFRQTSSGCIWAFVILSYCIYLFKGRLSASFRFWVANSKATLLRPSTQYYKLCMTTAYSLYCIPTIFYCYWFLLNSANKQRSVLLESSKKRKKSRRSNKSRTDINCSCSFIIFLTTAQFYVYVHLFVDKTWKQSMPTGFIGAYYWQLQSGKHATNLTYYIRGYDKAKRKRKKEWTSK